MDIDTKLRWCASYLAERFFANSRKPNYELSGYSADEHKAFCVDLALAFICLSQLVTDEADLRLTCQRLLKCTLGNVDYSEFGARELDDFDIEAPWAMYKSYNSSLFDLAVSASIFVYFGKIESYRAARLESVEKGRLFVETLQQMLPVHSRLQCICDVAGTTETPAPLVVSPAWDAAMVWEIATVPIKTSNSKLGNYRGNNGAGMSLEWGADTVWIKHVESLKPGQGYASELLKLLCRIADGFGVVIKGNAVVYTPDNFANPAAALSQEKLNDWYRRNGFVVEPMRDVPGADFITRSPR